ncbi:acyl-coenzyme A thioesterase THEM5 isoform X2 [Marmota monax]|uniref:acyl-coenzyme A thioesterase THEM5 isoform X2 n=1 Tax=Marmota monax TaxID=9995 RepID=UPI001EB08F23|nr:acyl-coenzyme A thioesterase THEM5 isoform X2 [Marmota monax]XP_048670794.1 acyl-coenzyme A thioesterase THEM5 isoform X2 [Marmota marmota marmota]
MMRRSFQVAARLGHRRALLRTPCILPGLDPAAAFGSSTDSLVSRFCPVKTDLKDYALPNASWCPDMLSLYQEFLEKTKSDGWVKLPSFKSNRDHIQGLKLPSGLVAASDKSDWRIFTRCIQVEGQGYEYVIFFHPFKKKSVCLFQPGPYLEGPPGLIPVGSLAVLNVQVEKIEDQKLYMSCITQSRDQETVYAKSSGVFLQWQLEEESSP